MRPPLTPLPDGLGLDVEAGGGAWRKNQKVPTVESPSPRWAGGAGAARAGAGGTAASGKDGDGAGPRPETVRSLSFMPRHHKSEVWCVVSSNHTAVTRIGGYVFCTKTPRIGGMFLLMPRHQ